MTYKRDSGTQGRNRKARTPSSSVINWTLTSRCFLLRNCALSVALEGFSRQDSEARGKPLASHRAAEDHTDRQWRWGSHFSRARYSPRMRKEGEVTSQGGWYLILGSPVTSLTTCYWKYFVEKGQTHTFPRDLHTSSETLNKLDLTLYHPCSK